MQIRKSKLLIATILLILLLSTSVTRAHAFTSGQSASLVIGQKDFTSNSVGGSQNGFSAPGWTIFDSSGNLWVGDVHSSRVLEFKPPFSTGMQASLVIGQPDFEASTKATSQSGLAAHYVIGIAFDSSGSLWVADHDNDRVLEFKPPFSTGMPASLVIGQKDFDHGLPGRSTDGLIAPVAVYFDHSGNLWVLDGGNGRVLEFKPPFANGMSASLVIGQANFETREPSTTRSTLGKDTDSDLTFDPSGNLWVSDTGNNRVLEFKPPLSNGMNASLVIGQPDFVSRQSTLSQSGLSTFPYGGGVTFDESGNLWVGDSNNNRVLGFEPPFTTGMSASRVIGQQDFTTNATSTAQNGLNHPEYPRFDSSGNLWVTDEQNNRVLEFSSTPVPDFPTASLAIIAVASLAVVALILRRFPLRRLPN